ncbi:MAG: ComF family protein [Pleurocapsa sp.]
MWQELISVFLQSRCPLCDRPTDKTICTYCQNKLKSYQLKQSDRWWRGNLPVFAWGKYDGQLKQAIAKLKYDQKPQIGKMLGRWLGRAWLDSAVAKLPKMTVISIPLHREKLHTRGFNQAEIIAQGFCQETGYTLQANGLIRQRNTKAMYELTPEARQKNLQNAFAVGKTTPSSPVLLLDDIYTAGTTVKEAAKVLRQHQIQVYGAIVTAKASLN